MNMVQVTISVVGVNATFVGFLEVMTNVEEFCVREVIAELPSISITGHQSGEPIVSDHDRGPDSLLTAIFKTCLIENCKLEYHITWSSIRIRLRKNISIVEKHYFDSSFQAFVNSNFYPFITDLDSHGVYVPNSGSGVFC